MLEVITHSHYETVIQLCQEARASIKLCSPFVKHDMMAEIINSTSNIKELSLITNINLQALHKKASDISAISELLAKNGHVFNCTTLHAKFYIFDDSLCLITSANLTTSGFKRNIECGIVTDDNRQGKRTGVFQS